MEHTKESIHQIVLKQREFFSTGATLDIKFRKEQLKKLRKAILDNQKQIIDALHEDLGRSEVESCFCDISDVVMEINEAFAEEVCTLLREQGFCPAVHNDFRGKARWVTAN